MVLARRVRRAVVLSNKEASNPLWEGRFFNARNLADRYLTKM